jgi:CBS domain-containing protein
MTQIQGYIAVREVMNPRTLLVDGMATVQDAIETMRDHGVSSLVIDKRDGNDEYGMVVVSDVARKLIVRDRSALRTNVYEIMTKPVLTVEAAMDIKYAIRLLQQFELSRALVLDKGTLCGIVTLRDLVFRYLLPSHKAEEAEADDLA